MKKTLLLLTLLSFLFKTNDLSAQITGSIMHDGVLRSYRLFLPTNYQQYQSLPLVFNLHGLESNGAQQEFYSEMNQVADTAKFFVCYAEGFKYNGVDQAWNVGWGAGRSRPTRSLPALRVRRFPARPD
jgi:polyhydroxybutyrate depolymerase